MRRWARVLCAPLLLTALASSAAEYNWRFALEEVDGSVQDAYAERFSELIEEKTDGAVSVKIYPYGTLGTIPQITELVQGGSIDFAFASPGFLAAEIPEAGVFTLHFVLSDNNRVNRRILADASAMPGLRDAYREKGLHLLDIIPEGWMTWTADKPLTSLNAFDGLKLRTMASPLLMEAYEAYGADPTPMPYSEVYRGLRAGIIDAQVNPIFAIEEMKFYEVQEVMTRAHHAQFIATVVSSPDFYNDLPDDIRAAVEETVVELRGYIFAKQAEYNERRLRKMQRNNRIDVVQLSDEQRERFREASMPVREAYIERAGERGRKILEAILQDVNDAENDLNG